MIDRSNEIFTIIDNKLKEKFKDIRVIGESIDIPNEFPTVTIDEISNLPTEEDGAELNKYALVKYRVQIFTTGTGKRMSARSICKELDSSFQKLNFKCRSMTSVPEIYNSKIYQINCSYEAVVGENGFVYRSK